MRLYTDGGEEGDTLFFTTVGGSTNVTSTPRSGSRCYNIATGGFPTTTKTLPAAVSEGCWRVGFRPANVNAVHYPFGWRNGTTTLGTIRVNAGTGKLEIWVGTTLQATGSLVLNGNTWYSLEIHIKIDASVGIVETRVDGIADASFSGNTVVSSLTTIDNVGHAAASGSSMLIDDLAYNDTSNADGLGDNSWCGDGHIQYLISNAAGDVTQLTPSTGSNYQNVDEIPPNGDTDYNWSQTAGQYDLYNLTTYTLGTNEIVTRVIPTARCREETAAGDKINLGLKTVSTEYNGADQAVTTSYARYEGTSYKTNPNSGAAWTQAQLDALQVKVKVV